MNETRILRLVFKNGASFDLRTAMSEQELTGEMDGSSKSIHIAGLNDKDEPTPFGCVRDELLLWCIMPYSAADRAAGRMQGKVTGGVIQ